MNFVKLTYTHDSGQSLWRPESESDDVLFRHCAEGLESVTTAYLENNVFPLLMAHGIDVVSMDDNPI